MPLYSKPGVAKSLAAKVVLLKLKLGLIRIRNRQEYRAAIVAAEYSAFISL